MCGIFGIVGRQDKNLIDKMAAALTHRGPDSFGEKHFNDASLGVCRLSIIDLKTGDQPIHNEDESLWVIQNGEIYNFQDIKNALLDKGHKFYTKTDTEVIVHAYEEYGENCVEHFNGMFAFVIWDTRKKMLFGARDRLGIKPFFYRHTGRYFLFSSEIKGILQDNSCARGINYTSLYNYLSKLFVAGDETIFAGIKRLPPGSSFIFKNSSLKIKQYWDIPLNSKKMRSKEEAAEGIRSKLEKAVKMQLVSDVPLGAFLSGGVDSNSIVAYMAKHTDRPVKTFTMGYTGNDSGLTNETAYALDSSRYFKTEHHEFVIDPLVIMNDLFKIAWFFDEPYAGSLPQYQLSKLAVKQVKVVLCGLGGDEMFGDYGRGARFAASLGGLAKLFASSPRLIKKTALVDLGARYISRDCIFSEKFKKELLVDDVIKRADMRGSIQAMFNLCFANKDFDSIEDLAMYFDSKTQMVNEYLRYTDCLSMANSLEARVPFLDHELVEYAASIPHHFMADQNDNKSLLKYALSGILPPGTCERKKGYFSLPYGAWLRNELKSFAARILSKKSVQCAGVFSYEAVNAVREAQLAGDDTKTYQVWNLIMFSIWHYIFIEQGVSDIGQIPGLDCGFDSDTAFIPA